MPTKPNATISPLYWFKDYPVTKLVILINWAHLEGDGLSKLLYISSLTVDSVLLFISIKILCKEDKNIREAI